MSDSVFISTEHINIQARKAYWDNVLLPLFAVDMLSHELRGEIESRVFESMLIWNLSLSAQRYRRDYKSIACNWLNQFLICALVDGHMQGRADAREVLGATGDVVIIDLAEPLDICIEGREIIVLALHRHEIEHSSKFLVCTASYCTIVQLRSVI
jgi:hypothetical protein